MNVNELLQLLKTRKEELRATYRKQNDEGLFKEASKTYSKLCDIEKTIMVINDILNDIKALN